MDGFFADKVFFDPESVRKNLSEKCCCSDKREIVLDLFDQRYNSSEEQAVSGCTAIERGMVEDGIRNRDNLLRRKANRSHLSSGARNEEEDSILEMVTESLEKNIARLEQKTKDARDPSKHFVRFHVLELGGDLVVSREGVSILEFYHWSDCVFCNE